MIYEVEGDILLSKAEAIAHGISPNDDFKQGLALSLRERWPDLYKDFRHFCHSEHPLPGGLWFWQGTNGFKCFNLFTQDPPKNKGSHPEKATTEYVNHAIRELHKQASSMGLKTLAITKIATGVGGLDWNEVKPIIDKHFAKESIKLYVYTTYKKEVAAKEA